MRPVVARARAVRRLGVWVLIVVAAMAVAGCAGGAPASLGPFTGAEATVAADNLAFAPATITLPSSVPLRLWLDNRDDAIPHSLLVSGPQGQIAQSAVITGPSKAEVRFGPLAPGTYQLTCTVHPSMSATLVIGP